MDDVLWIMVFGLWTRMKIWIMDHGQSTMDYGPWTMDLGLWTMDWSYVGRSMGSVTRRSF